MFCCTLAIDNYNIEITSFRIEENYDGRRPLKVKYTNNLIDDLKRRDFTINTICLDCNGNIVDLLNGKYDLDNRIIKCVGSSDIKFEEDALRILRAIRFACTLDFKLDETVIDSIKKYKENLKFLSSFRKRQELDKIVKNKGLYLIKKLDIEEELGISIPDKINYIDDLIGIYVQCEINIDGFFKKEELKKYNLLKKYYLKELDKYDLFILGKEILCVIDKINNTNLVTEYENLKIHDVKELDINLNKLNKDTKEQIIRAILYGKLENNSFSIANFMANIL